MSGKYKTDTMEFSDSLQGAVEILAKDLKLPFEKLVTIQWMLGAPGYWRVYESQEAYDVGKPHVGSVVFDADL